MSKSEHNIETVTNAIAAMDLVIDNWDKLQGGYGRRVYVGQLPNGLPLTVDTDTGLCDVLGNVWRCPHQRQFIMSTFPGGSGDSQFPVGGRLEYYSWYTIKDFMDDARYSRVYAQALAVWDGLNYSANKYLNPKRLALAKHIRISLISMRNSMIDGVSC